jgi:hypothetical protein
MKYEMAHFDLLTQRVAAESLRFLLLDAGPYRLEGGVGREFMLRNGVEVDWMEECEGDECAGSAGLTSVIVSRVM